MALMGLAPVVATASFPLINLPKFYLSFTILVSLILVKYPDRVGLVNTVQLYIPVPLYQLGPAQVTPLAGLRLRKPAERSKALPHK